MKIACRYVLYFAASLTLGVFSSFLIGSGAIGGLISGVVWAFLLLNDS